MGGWMNKEDEVCIHNKILHSHKKKNWNLAICDNTDGSKSKDGKQKPYTLLLCEIWKKEQTKTNHWHRGQFGGFQRQGGYEAGKMDGSQAYSS